MITNGLRVVEIVIEQLRGRGDNANVMSKDSFRKLVRNIKRTGRYPAVIVRARPGEVGVPVSEYEILDGHHRVAALRELHHAMVKCEVWEGVDEEEALVLLTTLNRLEGSDDPLRRAGLIDRLVKGMGKAKVSLRLPEDQARLERLLALRVKAPEPIEFGGGEGLPEAVTLFLSREQRQEFDKRLSTVEGGRTRSERLVVLLGLGGKASRHQGIEASSREEEPRMNANGRE